MDHHVRRLVHQSKKLVLIEDIERDVLGYREIVHGRRQSDPHLIPITDAITGFARLAVDLNAVRFDDFLDDRTAMIREHARQILIKPKSFDFMFRDQFDDFRSCLIGR